MTTYFVFSYLQQYKAFLN